MSMMPTITCSSSFLLLLFLLLLIVNTFSFLLLYLLISAYLYCYRIMCLLANVFLQRNDECEKIVFDCRFFLLRFVFKTNHITTKTKWKNKLKNWTHHVFLYCCQLWNLLRLLIIDIKLKKLKIRKKGYNKHFCICKNYTYSVSIYCTEYTIK